MIICLLHNIVVLLVVFLPTCANILGNCHADTTSTWHLRSRHGLVLPTCRATCRDMSHDMSACLSFWGGGIPNTTPTLPAKINDPNFVCAALKLCRLVSNQTSMMSICISCNLSTHRFCTEYLSEQSLVKEHLYIMPKDFTKDGKIRYRKVPKGKKMRLCFVSFASANGK